MQLYINVFGIFFRGLHTVQEITLSLPTETYASFVDGGHPR